MVYKTQTADQIAQQNYLMIQSRNETDAVKQSYMHHINHRRLTKVVIFCWFQDVLPCRFFWLKFLGSGMGNVRLSKSAPTSLYKNIYCLGFK